jgi:predicted Zn-dependent protease
MMTIAINQIQMLQPRRRYFQSRLAKWFGWAGSWCAAIALLLFANLASAQSIAVPQTNLTLPPAQVHPLPQTLAQWDEVKNAQGDYFDQIKPTQPGFLVWSHWPIQVYIAPPPKGALIKPEIWHSAILQSVQDWQPYLPIRLIESQSNADITISANPPQQRSGPRVRSAETRFELYISSQNTLAHRVSIYIRPNQTIPYISAAARHELGHGLGIWGHSQTPTDVMYFAQVRQPPAISARDINTLKRIYQQSTHLGWPIPAH